MGILTMKRILSLFLLFVPALVLAEPATNIAWTPDALNFVKDGNPKNGKKLAETCAGCHGEKGISQMEGYPSLAGQLATYTYKQLRDYADDKRTHMLMNSVATGLSKQDSADLAVWFASLPEAKNKVKIQELEKAEVLVSRGNGKKIIPPCFTCHGSNGQGERQDIPALAGQQIEYFITTLTEYKTGVRHNDVYSRMRLISEQLSEEDIKQLAQYYYQLKK
jgi:cytochrome c553